MNDFSFEVGMMKDVFVQECYSVSYELRRPSTIHKPKLYPDGDMWCALYGDNLQNGVSGFGDSPALALEDFDKNWYKPLSPKVGENE